MSARREERALASGKSWFFRGIRNGVPIMLGYLAVSFALGITARNAGLNWLQAGLASLLNNASAGTTGETL